MADRAEQALSGGAQTAGLSHVDGEVVLGCPCRLSDARVLSATALIGAYPGASPAAVVDALTQRFERARAQHRAAGRSGGVRAFEGLLSWMGEHGARVAAGCERHAPATPQARHRVCGAGPADRAGRGDRI
ncbi:hypothetical protein [Kineococcus indalonis]|uniref:hypothetical protein n=1 Tax=Kineococcus indalonis TaxID=2696566 RepID=UPI001412A8E8|nr:hypothetical protein [Kineococcus indalonis]NAZ86142.1 hypothetical protein [Kineococcus indalonis]